ncbi:hypothetical protein HDU67_003776 [Dinochytrium kinnereticum]|nr:hypothetical protein HDU67_003776 [Dinochytrium kinnereticum]
MREATIYKLSTGEPCSFQDSEGEDDFHLISTEKVSKCTRPHVVMSNADVVEAGGPHKPNNISNSLSEGPKGSSTGTASGISKVMQATITVLMSSSAEVAYETSRKDQALAEYLSLALGLSVVLVYPGDMGVTNPINIVKACFVHFAFALAIEFIIIMIERTYGGLIL